jgi:hypothetical protein
MNVYRVIFVNNLILSINKTDNAAKFDGTHYLEHDKGRAIFAIVKAENEEKARQFADELAKEVQHNFKSQS